MGHHWTSTLAQSITMTKCPYVDQLRATGRVIFFKLRQLRAAPVARSNERNGSKLGMETNDDMESRIP
ncbi:hypothetical protein TNCV_1781581 [Trichonephila clavipes]|nr:hypothetical protein TNCV_1781581 [Trichonephila clavipes]